MTDTYAQECVIEPRPNPARLMVQVGKVGGTKKVAPLYLLVSIDYLPK